MSEQKRISDNSKTIYSVVGMHADGIYDEEDTATIVNLGSFSTLEEAIICKDIYDDLDTTIHTISIVPISLFGEVPEIEPYLNFTVEEGRIIIRCKCVEVGTPPLLNEKDFFEALAYAEDKDAMIELAASWHKDRYGYYPAIEEDIPPSIESFLEL